MNGFPMTKTERRFLATLQTLTASTRIPPTLREIGVVLGGSGGHMCYLRESLEARGYVTWQPGRHRSLQLTEDGERFLAGETEVQHAS